MEDTEAMVEGGPLEQVPGEENESRTLNSEQIEMEIAQILDKINNFTQMVSELLDSGKSMLKELSNEFEERVVFLWQNSQGANGKVARGDQGTAFAGCCK
ncbi:uncharacterized protein [Primulina huaijiensis]|uniref:uncharacterized protein isoform X2 n=1 Tax=Primulina huaijiensis TaxID=1492673 RepID=UPI003CC74AD1